MVHAVWIVSFGMGDVDGDGIGARPGGEFGKAEIDGAFLALDDVGAVGADGIFRAHEIVQRHVDAFGEVLREHHLGDAGFEMALAEMAGDADQPVMPPIPRKRDAIIGLEGGLISPEADGAVLLLKMTAPPKFVACGSHPLS